MKCKLCFGWFLSAAFVCKLIATGIAAPDVTATKDDNLAEGLRKLVGDTINYTLTIGNGAAATDALSVLLTDPKPTNTTLVADSVHASPLAFTDSYTVVGNTKLYVGTTAPVPIPWQLLGTRTADANGRYSIVDIPPPGTPVRFYRSIFP